MRYVSVCAVSVPLTARMVQSLGARDVEEGAVVVGGLDTECGFGKATDQTVTGGPPFSRTGNERVEVEALVVGFANTAGDTNLGYAEELAPPLTTRNGDPGNVASVQMRPRRLTPRECERLQAFPDDYTLIPWRKGMAPDGPRYKALGNSMCVNVMRWIGQRIQAVDHA